MSVKRLSQPQVYWAKEKLPVKAKKKKGMGVKGGWGLNVEKKY